MAEFQYLDGGNTEAQDRLATSFLLAQTSAGLATTGVLAGLAVTQTTTASGAVLVDAGAAPVQASVNTGVALLVNDTQATLDVFTTEPMGGLPRNDVVAFDSITKALIFIKGEPNAAPTDPTVPDTACALARLRHAASASTIPTAKIDDLRVSTCLVGTDPPYLSLVAYSNGDYTTGATVATKTFTAETGKTYRVTAGLYGTQITSTGMPTVKLLDGGAEVFRMATGVSYAASTPVCGAPAVFFLVGAGASRTVSVTAQSTAGALRIAANGVNYLVVEQIA